MRLICMNEWDVWMTDLCECLNEYELTKCEGMECICVNDLGSIKLFTFIYW